MANSKLSICLAGVSALFLTAAHAQVVIENTDKPGNSGELQTAQSTVQASEAPRAATPATSTSSMQSQAGASSAGSTVTVRSAGPRSEADRVLQRDTLQGSERQTGTVKSGMVEGARFSPPQAAPAPAPAAPVTQYGATQAADTQSSRPVSDSSNVPAWATDSRSQSARDAASGVTQETMQGRSGAEGATASGSGALNKADNKAIMDMAMANMAEIEMGKMAQAKGSSEQVKTFAQQMIDDHGKALDEVRELALAKGVTVPTELDAKHRSEASKLEKMSGAAFDKAYMARAGVRDHKAVHAKLAKIESQASDADVKALASKMKPVVQQHLNSAQQMSKSKNTSKPDTESSNR